MKSTHISIKYRYDKTNIKIIKAGNLDLLAYCVDGLAIDASNSSQVSYDSNWYSIRRDYGRSVRLVSVVQ